MSIFKTPGLTGDQALSVMAAWNASPRLRVEFGDNFEIYAAFIRGVAAGRIRAAGGSTLPLELRSVFPEIF